MGEKKTRKEGSSVQNDKGGNIYENPSTSFQVDNGGKSDENPSTSFQVDNGGKIAENPSTSFQVDNGGKIAENPSSFLVDNRRKMDENPSSFQLSKRRKLLRKYDSDYLKFGFTWNGDKGDPRPQCVICGEILANESMRSNKLLRHIETKHAHFKNKPLNFFKSKQKIFNTSKNMLSHFTSINEKAMHASYLISLRIAKSGKPHNIGESLVLPAIKDAVGVMFGEKSLKEVELIPVSNNTVKRRIDEMSEWVEDQLINRVKASKFFSLQLDESTDIQGLSQLIVFIRFIWNNEPHEDILFCEPIIRGTSEAIFETLDTYIKSKEMHWMNCVGI
ncbi:zinc finger BED domain-containing protein 5-like [Pelobates fuscus]|uniref:zinc finger BED domain-containing protein 5-like n=1 Tax=Pelobates fuscus TaxID=191477 RepID=UPI002FE44861